MFPVEHFAGLDVRGRWLIWASTSPYRNGLCGLTVTFLNPAWGRAVTTCLGPPLHQPDEACPLDSAWLQHAKWEWRTAHIEQTHPEWFRLKTRG